MSIEMPKRAWWRRLIPWSDGKERAAWQDEGLWHHHDILGSALTTPEARRWLTTNADMAAAYGAVYAAVRRRSRAITKPRIALIRRRGADAVEIEDHPIFDALYRINESLTFRQGFGLIEQHKLISGKAYWIKRRNGLGVPVEFEIWPPDEVKPIPDKKKPWVPAKFERHGRMGTVETVEPKDVIWFRHFVDPRNPLNGLSPIGAVRVELDTGLEAARYNQRFFDNTLQVGKIFKAKDAGPAEVERIEQELERKFRGTDRAHRAMVTAGDIEMIEPTMSHKDMEFMAQQRWGLEQVARVMELSPVLLGDMEHGTFENTQQAVVQFWQVMADQAEATVEELNEFLIWPDFGDEFELVVRVEEIPALQGDRKLQAEIDDIYLKNGVKIINEVREREGLDDVPWGKTPLMPVNIMPLGAGLPPNQSGQASLQRGMEQIEDTMAKGWVRRLRNERDALIDHFKAADRRDIEMGDVDAFDWNWWERHRIDVEREIAMAFSAVLADAGFVDTPLLTAQETAVRYARNRGAELLRLEGRENVVKATREAVRRMVADTIAEGKSLGQLERELRDSFSFSKNRADMIARTETAKAQGKGSLMSYQSLGHEGKEWLTAGDERVDAGNPSGPCISAEGEGPIPLGRMFNNGFDSPPAHPRCRCTLLPVVELPRK